METADMMAFTNYLGDLTGLDPEEDAIQKHVDLI